MLRLDLVECATDVLGDVYTCLVCRGSGVSTPAAETEGVFQCTLDYIDLVFDPSDTPLVVELASFFELLSQFDYALLIFISGLSVEELATVFTQGGANRQLGQLLGVDSSSVRIDFPGVNSSDQIKDMKFPARFTQKKRE